MNANTTLTFNNGHKIPVFGLGTWKSKPGQVTAAVEDAIRMGYRHIDCAMVYENEKEVGEALATVFKEGVVKRKELFITSKLWCTFHSRGKVVPTLQQTLKDLQLDYLDMYLIHWPMGYKENMGTLYPKDGDKWLYSDVDYVETWLGMEEAVKQGLVKSIGVSNFNKDQIERVIAASSTVPATNQIEIHPELPQLEMINYCRSKGIAVTAYSPLGSPDRPWAKAGEPLLMDHPTVVAIAKKHGKTPAQILIAFAIQRGLICIPKSVTKSRIEANMKVFDFTLSKDDISTLEGMAHKQGRRLGLDWINDHQHWPFHTPY